MPSFKVNRAGTDQLLSLYLLQPLTGEEIDDLLRFSSEQKEAIG